MSNKKILSKGWKLLALNEICDLQNGYAFKSNDYVNISNTLNCRMSNIRPDGFFDIEHNQKFLPDSYTEKYKQYLLKDGDVIIAMTDMATEAKILGVPTIVKTQGKNLLLNQRVGKLIIKKPDLINFPYLKYALNREQVKKYFLKFAGGGLQINLGKEDILSVEIPLPPIAEQKRIAEILDRTQSLISKRKEAIAKLDTLTQSIFMEMFGDPELKGWHIETVNDVVHPSKGSIRTGPFGSQLLHSEFVTEGIAVLGIDNAVANEFRWGERRFISEAKYQELKRYTVKSNDVIITIMGTCGKCAIVPEDIPLSVNTKHLCCITLNQKKCLPRFLQAYFLFHPISNRYLEQTKKGAIMSGLNMSIIQAMPIFSPPLPLQKEFAQRVEAVEKLKATHRASLSQLEALFASLQHRAFRGEL